MVASADRRTTGQEAAPPPDAPPAAAPVAFDAALTAGGVFAGSAVLSVRLVLADGRVMRLELPTPAPDPAAIQRKLTEAEIDVLEVVEAMAPGDVWSVATIVEKAGYAVTTEMRQFLQTLPHLIARHRLGWQRAAARAKERRP